MGIFEALGLRAIARGFDALTSVDLWRRARRRIYARNFAPVSGDTFTILVADLENDSNSRHCSYLLRELEDLSGVHAIAFGRPFKIGDLGNRHERLREAKERATAYLREVNGDLIIYGEVVKEDHSLKLRFISRVDYLQDYSDYYLIEEGVKFPIKFRNIISSFLKLLILEKTIPSGGVLAKDIRRLFGPAASKIVQYLDALTDSSDNEAMLILLASDPLIRLSEQSHNPAWAKKALGWAKALLNDENRDVFVKVKANVVAGNALMQLDANDYDLRDGALEARAYYNTALSLLENSEEYIYRAGQTNNMANTYMREFDATGDSRVLTSAMSLYSTALNLVPKEDDPPRWAMIHQNMADCAEKIADEIPSDFDLDTKSNMFERAEIHAREALEVFTQDSSPFDWLTCTRLIARCLEYKAENLGDEEISRKAVEMLRDAVDFSISMEAPVEEARTRHALSIALDSFDLLNPQGKYLDGALAEAHQAATLFEENGHVSGARVARKSCAIVYKRIAVKNSDRGALDNAVEILDRLVEEYRSDNSEQCNQTAGFLEHMKEAFVKEFEAQRSSG